MLNMFEKEQGAPVPVSGSTRGKIDKVKMGTSNQMAVVSSECWYLPQLRREATGGKGFNTIFLVTVLKRGSR